MPKLLRHIKAPFKRRREHSDIKYLQFTDPWSHYNRRHYGENGDDDGDTCSTLTVSTNATMGNIPGTGRTIDTYVYQFFGRKLERFIFRVSMATLSPDIIFQYLWEGNSVIDFPELGSLRDVIVCFPKDKLSGLKGLVKQSQSDSLYRSAAALSALLHLATSWYWYGPFYYAVAAVEPIFHLETLANALDDSNPEKKYSLLLVGLARAQLHFIDKNTTKITEEFALSCRQMLLEILDLSCQIEAFADACTLLARVYSSILGSVYNCHLPSSAVHSCLETTYILFIFLCHFLSVQLSNQITHPLTTLFISTFTRLLEPILVDLMQLDTITSPELAALLPICALRSVYLTFSNMREFPTRITFELIHSIYLYPRRIRNTTSSGNTPIILRSYLTICTARNRRLLASLDELRREAGDSMALKYGSLSNPLVDPPFIDKSEDELKRSLDRAQSISVIENDLTREFLEARKPPPWDPSSLWKWAFYKKLQRERHRMGEYCRSNLDWDWDTASCLKRLFRIDKPNKCPNPGYAKQRQGAGLSATIDVPMAGVDRRTLDVTIPEKGPNVLEKIRVRYETETGEVKYKTFLAVPSVEDVTLGAGAGAEAYLSSGPETGHDFETSSKVDKDDACEVQEEEGSAEDMSDPETADEDNEDTRSFRTNGLEEDSTFIPMMDRPQYQSRVEEWIDTQVDSVA